MQFCKTGQYVVFIKLGQNIQSKNEIELAVFKAFREFLLAVLLGELLDWFSLVPTDIYGAHK